MIKKHPIFLVIIFAFGVSSAVLSQSGEKDKENFKLITSLMKNCVNHNWMLYAILFDEKPFKEYNTLINENANSKNAPSDFNKRDQYFKGEYGLDPRSDLSKRLIDPLDNEFIRMSSENPEPHDSMNAISKKEREIGVYYIYVFINKKKTEGKLLTGVKIPGAALITMMKHAYRDSCDWNSYFIAFGRWKNARLDQANDTRRFGFEHAVGSSSIENIVVVLTGAKDRVKELLTNIDWQVLNKVIKN